MEAIVQVCWQSWQDQQSQQSRSVESCLRTAFDFLLSHNVLFRGDSRRCLELADLFTLELKNKGPTRCCPLILIKDNGKTNQNGRVEYSGVVRHHNPLLCTVSHLSFYLFYRWSVAGEPVPQFQMRQQWYDMYLIKGASVVKRISYDTLLEWTNKVFNAAGCTPLKKTHAGKNREVFDAELWGVSDALRIAEEQGRTGAICVYPHSQAAIKSTQKNERKGGQALVQQIIRHAHSLANNGSPVEIRWVPGPAGMDGNEAVRGGG